MSEGGGGVVSTQKTRRGLRPTGLWVVRARRDGIPPQVGNLPHIAGLRPVNRLKPTPRRHTPKTDSEKAL